MDIKNHPDILAVLDQIEAQLNGIFQEKKIAGMAAALVYDQEILWSKGYGYADLEKQLPVDEKTVFDIGSIVKIFTDTMLMQLRDAGKLCLDDPIERYLPEFQLKPTFKDHRPPTFRQAAGHIAGIPREPGYHINDKGIPALDPMEVVLERVREMHYVYPPMEGIHYSNLAVYIMGHALARIAGQPYKQYVHEHIFAPLGMNHTGWTYSPEMQMRRAARYVPLYDNKPRAKASDIDFGETGAPGGGCNSTIEDMTRFLFFQFREGPAGGDMILGSETLKEMRLPVYAEPWGGIGIGWFLDRIADHKVVKHGGSAPGCSAALTMVPDIKLGVILLINEMIFMEDYMARSMLETVIPVITKILDEQKVKAPRPSLPAHADIYVGSFDTPEGWGLDVKITDETLKGYLKYAGANLLDFDLVQKEDCLLLIQGSSFDGELLGVEVDSKGCVNGISMWGLPFTKVA